MRDKLNDTLSSLQVQMLHESIAPVATRPATSNVVHDFTAPALIPLNQPTEPRAAPQSNLSLIDELLAKLGLYQFFFFFFFFFFC
jgi:hypothetical protein